MKIDQKVGRKQTGGRSGRRVGVNLLLRKKGGVELDHEGVGHSTRQRNRREGHPLTLERTKRIFWDLLKSHHLGGTKVSEKGGKGAKGRGSKMNQGENPPVGEAVQGFRKSIFEEEKTRWGERGARLGRKVNLKPNKSSKPALWKSLMGAGNQEKTS